MFNNYTDEYIVIYWQVINGKGKAMLTRQHILQTFENIEKLEKSSIYVAVTVLTDTGEWIMCASKYKYLYIYIPYI